ncbi:hypothetical protein B0H14DRAFT_3745475 [Mycena olivaceomarginata]|nr:hypothetical protein B0H14DRAFT_3745475 [Mycena olivaceomarginata]
MPFNLPSSIAGSQSGPTYAFHLQRVLDSLGRTRFPAGLLPPQLPPSFYDMLPRSSLAADAWKRGWRLQRARRPRRGAGVHELGRASGAFVAFENTVRPDDDVQGYEDELSLRQMRRTTGYRPRTASAPDVRRESWWRVFAGVRMTFLKSITGCTGRYHGCDVLSGLLAVVFSFLRLSLRIRDGALRAVKITSGFTKSSRSGEPLPAMSESCWALSCRASFKFL